MKWLLRTALWFAFGHAVIVACSDAALLEPKGEEEEGTGGRDPGVTPGSGGNTSSGGRKSPPPKPATGGFVGAGGSPVPGAGGSPVPTPRPCRKDVVSVESYCSKYSYQCDVSYMTCVGDRSTMKQSVEQGCGYLRYIYYEQNGTVSTYVYDQFSLKLVHSSIEQGDCTGPSDVGTPPQCFSWGYVPCGSAVARDAGGVVVVDAATD